MNDSQDVGGTSDNQKMQLRYKADSASLSVRYAGQALDEHRMSVRDLAPALLALADAIDIANALVGDSDRKPSVAIKATSEGSFVVDLVITSNLLEGVTGSLLSLLNGKEATAAANLSGVVAGVGAAIGLLKKFAGKKIVSTDKAAPGRTRITLGDGTTIDATAGETVLVESREFRAAMGRAAAPTRKPGIDTFELSGGGFQTVSIRDDEIDHIRPAYTASGDDVISDETHEVVLKLDQISFRKNRVWKVVDDDNGKPFSVTIRDPSFLARIDAGEPFRKGDTIHAVLHVTQRRARDGGLSITREIVEILNHEQAASNTPQELPLNLHDA